jgi:TRAP-type mannitol/chloroaromatic compound transport system substrate-binding protein
MKSKTLFIPLMLILVLFSSSVACEAQKVYKWKLQAWRSAAEPGMAYYKEMFEKTLPAMTGGRLQIQMFWGGELVATPDMLDSVKMGVIEMGLASSYTYQGVIPVAAVEYGLPFGLRTPSEKFNFFYGKNMPGIFGGWRAIDLLREEYAKQGVFLLASGVDCWPGSFMFRTPINSIKDIEGKKVRASGLMMDWIRMLGGDGVFITGEETYTSLQSGAIDGVSWGSSMGKYTTRLHEVAKFFLYPPLMPVNSANVIVNQKAWNSLPDDLKAILEQAVIMAGIGHTVHQNWTGERWGLVQLQKSGVTMNYLEGEDLKKAEEVAFKLWEVQAKRSPASKKLVEMKKDYLKTMGYLE